MVQANSGALESADCKRKSGESLCGFVCMWGVLCACTVVTAGKGLLFYAILLVLRLLRGQATLGLCEISLGLCDVLHTMVTVLLTAGFVLAAGDGTGHTSTACRSFTSVGPAELTIEDLLCYREYIHLKFK